MLICLGIALASLALAVAVKVGHTFGVDAGLLMGTRSYHAGHEVGFRLGVDHGTDRGHARGVDEGFAKGYRAALGDARIRLFDLAKTVDAPGPPPRMNQCVDECNCID